MFFFFLFRKKNKTKDTKQPNKIEGAFCGLPQTQEEGVHCAFNERNVIEEFIADSSLFRGHYSLARFPSYLVTGSGFNRLSKLLQQPPLFFVNFIFGHFARTAVACNVLE